MLEIASQITLCLLIAALIGFIIGFIVAKGMSKKPTETSKEKKTKEKVEKVEKPATEVKEPVAKEFTAKKSIEEVETLAESIDEETTVLEILNEEETEEVSTQKPELFKEAKDGEKDALTKIKGIGPKVEEKLNEAGIYHFSQIANWTEANINWLEINTAFAHRAKKDLWVNQAKSLI